MVDGEIERLVESGELHEEIPVEELDTYDILINEDHEPTTYSGSLEFGSRVRKQDWRYTPCSPDEIEAMNRIEAKDY